MQFSIPYGPSLPSKWAPVTSTINFCEEDYYMTPYVAEVINVTTNGIFLYLAYFGFRNAVNQGHPPIFAMTYIAYSIIGIGSILFHSTLKYPMQLIDELAMIYTVLISLFATFSYDRSPWLQWSIFAALATTGVTITSVYHYLHEPLFHQNAFALLMITLLGNGFYKTETLVKYTNPKARILIWQIVGWGSVVFLSAFALWNVDNAYCTELRRMRRSIGMPWGFLLELHAIWHIGTGVGGYYLVVWGELLRICCDRREDEYVLYWPTIFSFPYIDMKSRTNMTPKQYIALRSPQASSSSSGSDGEVKAANGTIKKDL